MNHFDESIGERVQRFRQSIAPDLYSLADFLAWTEIESELRDLDPAIGILQDVVDHSHGSDEHLEIAFQAHPAAWKAIRELLAAMPGGVGFADGRELPEKLPSSSENLHELAGLLSDLGLWRILAADTDVKNLITVAAIGTDARRRGVRRTSAIQARVRQLVAASVQTVSANSNAGLRLFPSQEFPREARAAEFVVGTDHTPIVAIATVFQAQSGGRQQRDLALTYPTLQEKLDSTPMSLVLIADGRGIAETPERILRQLFDSLAGCMTVRQAEAGMLSEVIAQALERRGLRVGASAPLGQIIESGLDSRVEVKAQDLPGTSEVARVALATYSQRRSDLALRLSPFGDVLSWERSEAVIHSSRLRSHFDPKAAIDLFADIMGASATGPFQSIDSLTYRLMTMPDDPILPQQMLAASTVLQPNSQLLHAVSKLALQVTPEPHVAALLVPDPPSGWGGSSSPPLALALPATITTIRASKVWDLARRREAPRNGFVKTMLSESDLTKVSPFVLSSVTPERMFYGREGEEAILASSLATNSVALLGGRRIGKTSLMLHAHRRLEEAGFLAYFGDCQTVRDWDGFANLAERRWGIRVPKEFQPEHLFDLVDRLRKDSGQNLVLLLDEIDQLLDWDEQQGRTEVPEAFFRACRTISQEGQAQFVFSGERVIARKLWDAHSPHWNFCRPLQLRQLTKEDAVQLLLRPLSSLQIQVAGQPEVLEKAWEITTGHPQIMQFLGDKLIRRLNERSGDARARLEIGDLDAVSGSFEFREHYLETYWGQATRLEKILSMLVAQAPSGPAELIDRLERAAVPLSGEQVTMSMRILDLYGIVDQTDGGYRLRAEWFPTALEAFGGIEGSLARTLRAIA